MATIQTKEIALVDGSDWVLEPLDGFRDQAPTVVCVFEPPAALEAVSWSAALRHVSAGLRRLALQTDLHGASAVAAETVAALVGADRAHCLLADVDSGTIWAEASDGWEASTSLGLVGFAVRTGHPIAVERADSDPRYDRSTDDPAGVGDEQIAIQPVITNRGEVHAVFTAVRSSSAPAFSKLELRALALFATSAAPLFDALAIELEAERIWLEEAADGMPSTFREQAVEAYQNAALEGVVVRAQPRSARAFFWAFLTLFLLALGFVALGRVGQYAEGPGVIVARGRRDVPAKSGGIIESVELSRGQRVHEGQVIARLHQDEDLHDLEAAEREFSRQLLARLRNPGDGIIERELAELKVRRDRARAKLEERLIVSPVNGWLSDVRVRPGQAVEPGQSCATIVSDESELFVHAFIPASDRPLVRAEEVLRFHVAGHRDVTLDLVVESVADEVMGPTAVRTLLGQSLGDTVLITGPVVLVEARIRARTFESNGKRYDLHDGMPGRAEVRVGTQRVLALMLPSLENF